MKSVFKVLGAIFSIVIILMLGCLTYYFCATANAKLLDDKLINLNRIVTYYDKDGQKISEEVGGNLVTDISNINDNTKNAFIAIEDKRFYHHNGIDLKRLLSATKNNVKSLSFKEGASTISQQLIKNTHLSSEKTINRKLTEIKLARILEKKYSKDQILEKYLNTIYFGDNCYGITAAAKHYFDKNVSDLSINESATLAAIIKAPSHYSPFINEEKCFNRKNLVLKAMKEQGYISQCEYDFYKNEKVNTSFSANDTKSNNYEFLYFAKKQIGTVNESSPYSSLNLEIYTTQDTKAQRIIESALIDVDSRYYKSAILIDKDSNVRAYFSNCGDINRQLGSIIKPLLVYAPAIENNVVNSYSHIIDEKTNFNGYSPSNYNEKYYGKVTVKESLAKSLNVCAAKILNYTGIEKSLSYVNKTDLEFTDADNSLSLALGSSVNGSKLSEITSAYNIFLNKGYYSPITTVSYIKHNSNVIKKDKKTREKIYSFETVSIINDSLNYAVTEGTAKKLSFLPFEVLAKTGTVGNENGNTDAYVVSYNSDYVLGIWIGSKDELMPNSVSGGTLPTILAGKVWDEIYKTKQHAKKIEKSSNIIEVDIDKISYDNDDTIILADENAPERYVEKILINKKDLPKNHSRRFTLPKIETPQLLVNNNEIKISLCLAEYYGAEIYKEFLGKKFIIKDIKPNECSTYIDKNILPNTIYKYSVIPYYKNQEGKKFYGEEIFLKQIKTPSVWLGENWWDIETD